MVFSHFRSQYPQGSIITEMLSKVDGMHAFRATIKDQDCILSTATAIDSDLETAEDRAIKRALTILGISFEKNYGIQATLMPQITQPVLNSKPAQHFLQSITESITESPTQSIFEPTNYEFSEKLATKYSDRNETEIPVKPHKSPQIPQQSIDTSVENSEIPAKSSKSEPIDLSNQLSQIMVEMERIGWTKQQGKDYLQLKYKKNSRDQLSATEVFDFLDYLKSQSDTF